MVGCQTNLKFGEQKRVFSMIPALKNAEFLRYGVMHRNTYLNGPNLLNEDFSVKTNENLYFAGQMTGVEGYVESAASGLAAAVNLYLKLSGAEPIRWSCDTVMGALARHVATPTADFQPMNANYGILSPLDELIRDKALRKRKLAERALAEIETVRRRIDSVSFNQ